MKKTAYNEHMQNIVEEYRRQGHTWPATTRAIAAWAVRTGQWQAPQEWAVGCCADDLAKAMREADGAVKGF